MVRKVAPMNFVTLVFAWPCYVFFSRGHVLSLQSKEELTLAKTALWQKFIGKMSENCGDTQNLLSVANTSYVKCQMSNVCDGVIKNAPNNRNNYVTWPRE